MNSDLTMKEQVGIGAGVVGAVSLVGILGFFYYKKQESSENPSVTLYVDSESSSQVNNLPVNINYAVGKYNGEYPGWRRATEADWTNPTIQKELVDAHQKDGGWALLQKPLACNDKLFVSEGAVMIDKFYLVNIGFKLLGAEQLHRVYSVMNYPTNEGWTWTLPAFGNNWTVYKSDYTINHNPPCLFIRYTWKYGGRSKQPHKYKRSRKQKKGTKI